MWKWSRRKPPWLPILAGAGVLLILLFGILLVKPRDAELVKQFKQLDQMDFDAQKLVGDKEKSEGILRRVYLEPQLSVALDYLTSMRNKRVRLETQSVEYLQTEILKKKKRWALLRVVSKTKGGFYSLEAKEQLLQPVEVTAAYEVEISKQGDSWKISSIRQKDL